MDQQRRAVSGPSDGCVADATNGDPPEEWKLCTVQEGGADHEPRTAHERPVREESSAD